MAPHPVTSKSEWIEARRALLAAEKEQTRRADALARRRRELPWVKVEASYLFETPTGPATLAELFGPHDQLVVYHFMFGPDWAEGCPSCSFVSDHLDGAVPHLAARDVALVMVSRAPIEKITAFKRRMGWQFPWVSSHASPFNHDFGVHFTPEERATGAVDYNFTRQPFPSAEAPGASVFYKDPQTGEIFLTYATFGRGLDAMVGTYVLLDLVPKGRDEDRLAFDMVWVRHHDRYDTGFLADPDRPYWPEVAIAATAPCCGSAATR